MIHTSEIAAIGSHRLAFPAEECPPAARLRCVFLNADSAAQAFDLVADIGDADGSGIGADRLAGQIRQDAGASIGIDQHLLAVVIADGREFERGVQVAVKSKGGVPKQNVHLAPGQNLEPVQTVQRDEFHRRCVAQRGRRYRAAEIDIENGPFAIKPQRCKAEIIAADTASLPHDFIYVQALREKRGGKVALGNVEIDDVLHDRLTFVAYRLTTDPQHQHVICAIPDTTGHFGFDAKGGTFRQQHVALDFGGADRQCESGGHHSPLYYRIVGHHMVETAEPGNFLCKDALSAGYQNRAGARRAHCLHQSPCVRGQLDTPAQILDLANRRFRQQTCPFSQRLGKVELSRHRTRGDCGDCGAQAALLGQNDRCLHFGHQLLAFDGVAAKKQISYPCRAAISRSAACSPLGSLATEGTSKMRAKGDVAIAPCASPIVAPAWLTK